MNSPVKKHNAAFHCHKPSDIPYSDHYAIIMFTTVTDSYDTQRTVQEYVVYTDKEEWEQAVSDLTLQKYRTTEFVPIKATRATVRTTVSVA